MGKNYNDRYNNFMKNFNNLLNSDEFIIIGDFVDNKTKIKLKHNCGNIIYVTPKNLFRKENKGYIKCKCNKETGRNGGRRKTNEEFLKELSDKNIKIIPLEEYSGAKTNILCKCPKCGHEWKIRPDNLLTSPDCCPSCAKNIKKNKSIYESEIYKIYGEEYKIIGDYVNSRTPILTQHKCGHIWCISPDNLKRGKGCPLCHRLSKGEYIIYNTLKKYNIDFIKEYVFQGTKYRYDFALFKKNNLLLIIEYDGIQHYFPQEGIFGGIKGFAERIKNDKIKTQLCNDKNIKLIRIPYTDFNNLENIIKNILVNNNFI